MLGVVGRERFVPARFCCSALVPAIPRTGDSGRDIERCRVPAKFLASGRDFVITQRSAVCGMGILEIRTAKADMLTELNERGRFALLLCLPDRLAQ